MALVCIVLVLCSVVNFDHEFRGKVALKAYVKNPKLNV